VSLGYGSHAGVPANSTVLDGNSQFSWVATAGTHTITFAVDVDNHVVEANESNNSRPVTVTVTGPGAEPPAFTLFSNPDDPLLLKAETIDGNVIEYFGEKNAEGLATAFNAVHVESVINGPTTILLDEQSRPVQIFGADGVTLQISWQSETLVRVTAISADGTIQVSVPVDLTTQSVNQPSVSTSTQAEVMDASVQRAPRGDIPMDAFTAPLDMESSVQTLNQALSTAATSQVNVRRCGAPVNNATFPRI